MGKYFLMAKDYKDIAWRVTERTNSTIKIAVTYIKARIKYQMVELSVLK